MKKNINFSTKEFIIEKPNENIYLYSKDLNYVLDYIEGIVPKNKILKIIKHSDTEAIITLYDPSNLSTFYVQNWIIKLAPEKKEYFIVGAKANYTTWVSNGASFGSGSTSAVPVNSNPAASYGVARSGTSYTDLGDIKVNGNATINGNLSVEGDLTINGKIIVNGEEV